MGVQSMVFGGGLWRLLVALAVAAWRTAHGQLPPRLLAYPALTAAVLLVGALSRTVEFELASSLISWAFSCALMVVALVGCWAQWPAVVTHVPDSCC